MRNVHLDSFATHAVARHDKLGEITFVPPLFYLASPIKHENIAVIAARRVHNTMAQVTLMSAGYCVYSPLCHCFFAKLNGKLPDTWEFWAPPSYAQLGRSDGMIILTLEGWRVSVGVAAEVDFCLKHRIPMFTMNTVYDIGSVQPFDGVIPSNNGQEEKVTSPKAPPGQARQVPTQRKAFRKAPKP